MYTVRRHWAPIRDALEVFMMMMMIDNDNFKIVLRDK